MEYGKASENISLADAGQAVRSDRKKKVPPFPQKTRLPLAS
jgi:hypothetical protein